MRSVVSLFAVGGLIAVVIFAFGWSELDPAALFGLLSPSAHLAAATAAALTLVGRSVRSQLLARVLGERLGFGTALRAQFAADAGGFVTPARLGSEAGKLLVLHRGGVGVASGAVIHLAEVLCEASAVALVVVLLLLALPFAEALPALGALSYVLGVGGVVAGSLFLAALPVGAPPRILARFRIGERRWGEVQRMAARFLEGFQVLKAVDRQTIALLLAVTGVTIIVRLAILPLLLGGVPESEGAGLVVWPLLLLYGGAVVPLPGAGGTIELGFLAAFRGDFSPTLLAAVLLWWRIYTHYLSAALGGLVLWLLVIPSHEVDLRIYHKEKGKEENLEDPLQREPSRAS